MDKIEIMPYRQYKQHYSDCKTVSGSYDTICKTIKVIIPEGREKPSGVRNRLFSRYELKAIYKDTVFTVEYKAVSEENAQKQHIKYCKKKGFQVADPAAVVNGNEPEQLKMPYSFKINDKTFFKYFYAYSKAEAQEQAKVFCKENNFDFLGISFLGVPEYQNN